jgi:muramoyltetrapeptide carboxypeptidase
MSTRLPGKPATILPASPQPGDTIGVIAPASAITKEALDAGCESLRKLGYRVFFFESILERDLYFAGVHERRVWEIEQMFKKDFVKGIICARGGYGANHLLSRLNLDVIRANPKMFIGYSDVTSLLTWITDQTGTVTFHGPMVAKDYALSGAFPPLANVPGAANGGGEQIATGSAEGPLYGGCLSMLTASLGTPYEIEASGTILFLEDIAAKPFQIDRMLMQLRFAGKLKDVRGIVFGEMPDCAQLGGQEYTLHDVIRRTIGDLGVPIGFGIRSGHLNDHSQPGDTLAIGMNARLTVTPDRATIEYV